MLVTLILLAILLGPSSSRAQIVGCHPNTDAYPCLYVSNNVPDDAGNNVSVINATSRLEFNGVEGGLGPQGLAVTPDNAFVYVALQGDGSVVAINTATNEVTPITQGIAGFPTQIAITPDGAFAYVVESAPAPNRDGLPPTSVQVIDTGTKQVIDADNIFNVENPTSIAFGPIGAFAYLADLCGGVPCVKVIDTALHVIVSTVPIPGAVSPPSGTASIAVSPDGSLVCMSVVNGEGNVEVAFVGTSNNAFLDTLKIAESGQVSNHGFGITPGGVLYAGVQPGPAGVAGVVIPINVSTRQVGKPINVGSSQRVGPAIAMGASGTLVYVTNADDNTVSVIRTATNTVTSAIKITSGSSPQNVASMSLAPPIITAQPASQFINPGETATLSVVATDIAPLSYQWFQGQSGDTSAPISGATSSSFTTQALNVSTSYWVLVGNIAGSVNSDTAVVGVNQPPTCTLELNGSDPANLLMVTAIATCSDPQGQALTTTIEWGDGAVTTQNSGVITATHTYKDFASYVVTVHSVDSFELRGSTTSALGLVAQTGTQFVFPGQTAIVTVSVDSLTSGSVDVKFECFTVTDGDGKVQQAADFGITCNSIPTTVTLQHGFQDVQIAIHTTGAALSSLPLGQREKRQVDPTLYGFFLLFPAFVFLGLKQFSPQHRGGYRPVLVAMLLGLLAVVLSCGGGYTAPTIQTQPTPSGSYQVTVIDVPVNSTSGFVQTSLIVPLTVE